MIIVMEWGYRPAEMNLERRSRKRKSWSWGFVKVTESNGDNAQRWSKGNDRARGERTRKPRLAVGYVFKDPRLDVTFRTALHSPHHDAHLS